MSQPSTDSPCLGRVYSDAGSMGKVLHALLGRNGGDLSRLGGGAIMRHCWSLATARKVRPQPTTGYFSVWGEPTSNIKFQASW